MSALTTVAVLREAKTVLQRNGWFQGDYYDVSAEASGTAPEACPVCLLGAINIASGSAPDNPTIYFDEVARLLASVLKDRRESRVKVPLWNDLKKRTVEDVYALLDEAIARAEAGDPQC